METSTKMNSKTIVYVVVAVIVIIGAALWLSQRSAAPSATIPSAASTPQGTAGLGADIYNQVVSTSTQTVPETNPFKAVQTNPFGQ